MTMARCSSVKCVFSPSRFTSRRSPTRGSGGCWAPVPRSWQCWAPSSCTRWASISVVSRARLWGGGDENKQPSQQGEFKINNLLSKVRACSPCAHHPSCAEGLDRVIQAPGPGVCALRGESIAHMDLWPSVCPQIQILMRFCHEGQHTMIPLCISCQHMLCFLQDLAGHSQICWNFPIAYCWKCCCNRREYI